MPHTLPFKAWLPKTELANEIASRSSGYSSNEEVSEFIHANKNSYLHAVKPHLYFREEVKVPEKHFKYAFEFVEQLKANKRIEQLGEESYLLYRQTSIDSGFYYQGVVGLCTASAYKEGSIKVHEHTLTPKENLLIEHLKYSKMAGEPVLVMHDAVHDLEQLKREEMIKPPLIHFEKEGLRHEVWVPSKSTTLAMQAQLDQLDEFYIADGHHRSAATTRYIFEEETIQKGFLSLFIDKADLHIEAFHRLVQCDSAELFSYLGKNGFSFQRVNSFQELNLCKNQFGFFVDQEWFQVHYNLANNKLDVQIIEEHIINQFAGIANSKTDDRVDFFEGNKPIYLAENLVNNAKFDLLIALHPCSISDICAIADNGETMPPKSTYVLPKLLTGLTMQSLD